MLQSGGRTSVTICESLNTHKRAGKPVNKAESRRAVANRMEGGSAQKEGRGLQESVHSDSWGGGHIIMVWKKR